MAQQKTITGTVTGKLNSAPLQCVTVQAKTKAAQTGADSKFSIEAAAGDNLTFSYVGMLPVVVKVTGATQNVNVEMVLSA